MLPSASGRSSVDMKSRTIVDFCLLDTTLLIDAPKYSVV